MSRASHSSRHRAVLLTLVGVLLGVAAFDESWLRPALLVAFVSKGAFLTLTGAKVNLSNPRDFKVLRPTGSAASATACCCCIWAASTACTPGWG